MNPSLAKFKEYEAADRLQHTKDIEVLMSTEYGRRLMLAIITRAGVYAIPTSLDNLGYDAGRRTVALELMQEINAVCPQMLLKAQEERNKIVSYRKTLVNKSRKE